MRILKAKPSECQKIRELEISVWENEFVTSIYDVAFMVRYGYAFIAKENEKIIGAIIAMKTKDDEINIVDWIVDKQHRNKGIGVALHKRLQKEVGHSPIIAYVEDSNKTSLNTHQKLGFHKHKKAKDPFYVKSSKTWWIMKKHPN